MKISLVTATFNRSLQLKRGLMSILAQDNLPPDMEIIVVDDGSVDDTKAVIDYLRSEADKKYPFLTIKYIYLHHPEHRISSIPRNVGIKQASGDIIIFTESECLHIGNTINQILQKMIDYPNNTPVATQIWSMGQNIYKKLDEESFKYPARILSHPYAQLTDSANMDNKKAPNADFAITGSINCVTGCFFACQKQWLEDIGGFDEEFEGHGWDDWDLFNRLAKYDKGIIHCDDIVVIHQWHEKNYPYNIYEAAEKNGARSAQRITQGEFVANKDKEWGQI